MAEPNQCLLLNSPEAVEIARPIFLKVAVRYCNGKLTEPPTEPHVVVFGPEEWQRGTTEQCVAAGIENVQHGTGDISEIDLTNPLKWLRDRIKPYRAVDQQKAQPVGETTSRPPVDPTASSPVEHTVDTPPNEPEGYYASAPPADHPDIPAGAETAVRPFARKPRAKLSLVEGNTARWPETEAEPLPAALSEDFLADHFVKTEGENWRFVTEWGLWLNWRGDGWHRDTRNEVADDFIKVTRQALEWREAQALTPDGKRKLNSKRTAWNARDVAAAHRSISILAEELDADPMLLGVPGGAVDLRSGKLIEAEPSQYITRRTAVPPVDGPHPLFDRVLARACNNHDGMREYLMRWFGYMLTGSVQEEAFIFLHGPGGSGKSTLIKAITEIMGDYATTISMDAFTESKHERHSQEIAKLAGSRLVYASETEEGRRFKESLIKLLTGGDKITAHKMRQDDFEFKPTFKILIYGNSVPHLKSVGEEMKRRIHLIEYAASLTPEERDSTLKMRLVAEYPAILASMIRGAVDWQDCNGLGKPESVETAVDTYLEGEDSFAEFIAECVERADGHKEPSSAVYRRYRNWAGGAGEYAVPQKRFLKLLQDRGFTYLRTASARLISGLRLRQSGPEYPPPASYHD